MDVLGVPHTSPETALQRQGQLHLVPVIIVLSLFLFPAKEEMGDLERKGEI